MALGVLVAAPAFAQQGAVTGTATAITGSAGGAPTGAKVCINADANVKGVAGWLITAKLPTGYTMDLKGGTAKAAFTADAAMAGTFIEVNDQSAAKGEIIIAIVGTEDKNGPLGIGCFDVIGTVGGQVSFAVEANNANSDPVTVGSTPVDLPKPDGPPVGEAMVNLTQTQISGPAGAVTGNTICLNAANMPGTAGWLLKVKLPTSYTMVQKGDPPSAKAGFTPHADQAGTFVEVNDQSATASTVTIAIVGTADKTGNIGIGCFDVAGTLGGNVTLEVEANNANSDPVTAAAGTVALPPAGVVPPPRGKGDLTPTADGKVDITDVRAAIKLLFGIGVTPELTTAADMDNNGTLDLRDVRMLLIQVVRPNG
jgi:hypothetical protein